MTVVYIAGMHRSGTSMVARLLNLCGVYLGQESDLLPPHPENLEGFWENHQFMVLNDEILSQLNAGWDYPPKANSKWEKADGLYQLRTKASELTQRFSTHKIWGWKDPRNSLTFPFWREIIPSMKVVICIRNPLEVAHSLVRRNNFSPTLAYHLWYEYNSRILSFTEQEASIITHYDAYFHDPYHELKRVLDFLEIDVLEKDLVTSIMNAVSPSLRHNKSTLLDLMEQVPSKVIDLYQAMCQQSGRDIQLPSGVSLEKNLQSNDSVKETIRLLSLELLRNKQIIMEKDQSIQALSTQLMEKVQALQRLNEQILEIYRSRSWRLTEPLRKLVQAVLHKKKTG